MHRGCAPASLVAVCLVVSTTVYAADDPVRDIVVDAGRPLHVALDRRVAITRVGQPVTGTLADPVFVYDRLVLAKGTPVRGHVVGLEGPPRTLRIRAIMAGDFSPHRRIDVTFDTVILPDGREVPMSTVVRAVTPRRIRQTTPAIDSPSEKQRHGRVRAHIAEVVADTKARVHDAVATVTRPGRRQRLEYAAINMLPYHRQYLDAGTVYAAELTEPAVVATTTEPPLPIGATSAAGTVIGARLVTPLDSSRTPRGTVVEAVVTEPLLSASHELLIPEGTRVIGEVTLARRARRLRRNGTLRFLFERVELPQASESAPLLASLHSIDTSSDAHVALDDEGGVTVTNPKTRFIAPALAVLALRASTDHEREHDHEFDDVDREAGGTTGHPGGLAAGGFFGFGLVGAALSQVSKSLGTGFAVIGVARSVYRSVLGKGHDVVFEVDTPLQLQLAPGP